NQNGFVWYFRRCFEFIPDSNISRSPEYSSRKRNIIPRRPNGGKPDFLYTLFSIVYPLVLFLQRPG
ncbi:MAG: hypothetical protein DBX90_02660, partial [Lentisphaerae bacterium]